MSLYVSATISTSLNATVDMPLLQTMRRKTDNQVNS